MLFKVVFDNSVFISTLQNINLKYVKKKWKFSAYLSFKELLYLSGF